MGEPQQIRPFWRGAPAWLRLACLLGACLLAGTRAHGACIDLPFADLQSLAELDLTNASQAVARANTLIAAAKHDHNASPLRTAALYAVAAQSNSILELDDPARAAALAGLGLNPPEDSAIRLSLMSSYAETVYDVAGLKREVAKLSAAQERQPHGSQTSVCLLNTIGWLQHRLNQDDLAVATLTNAYRESALAALSRQRALAAEALSKVMDSMGDFDQALDLTRETIEWEQAHHATQMLTGTRYARGEVLLEKRDYQAALVEFTEARRIGRQLGDQQSIGFADLRMCEARIRLGQTTAARDSCASAMTVFESAGVGQMVKETRALLAEADLNEGRYAASLATLDSVLDQKGADIVPRWVPHLYELRARANAGLRRYDAAYADLRQYVELARAATEADRARSGSVLRARFRVDNEIERNTSLKRELSLSKARSDLQREQLQRRTEVMAAGVALIVLMTYILLTTQLHRRQLQRIATEDPLTGLPNRRRIAELATAALTKARAQNEPLSLALVDLDHFKMINDACGHAVGDRVLKDLADLTRRVLGPGEVMGRWGGEEFLLLLPGLPLDLAMARVEALRAAALEIELPESGVAAGLRVSLSAGMATSYEGAASLDEIIARADVALYEAKRDGRNLVRIADESLQAATTAIRRALRSRRML
jgi:diguanylate cyclase (GGDEF)-like protein